MKTGIELIADERARQIHKEGWTPEHDDAVNCDRQLAAAAHCYLSHYVARAWTIENELGLNVTPETYTSEPCPYEWPENWDESAWKPKGKIEDLTRIGALITAELDRLQRLKTKHGNLV